MVKSEPLTLSTSIQELVNCPGQRKSDTSVASVVSNIAPTRDVAIMRA